MKAKHPTTPHHATALTDYIAVYQHYLGHADPAARLVGLRAMAEYIDKLITTDYAAVRPMATARHDHLVTRIRRFFHALPYVD